MLRLVGPGAAGKSTAGALVATRLNLPFIDLDGGFSKQHGDIGEFIRRNGYGEYARQNVETYRSMLRPDANSAVLALSSGFMTYADDIHPDYPGLRQEIICSPTTFVLLPSLALEVCVSETVRRQSGRPFTRSLAREEAVIRERFPIYVGLAARKIETMRSPDAVVDEILMALQQQASPQASPSRSAIERL
jgi:shikimate kinase